jgi:hypothetical protein
VAELETILWAGQVKKKAQKLFLTIPRHWQLLKLFVPMAVEICKTEE